MKKIFYFIFFFLIILSLPFFAEGKSQITMEVSGIPKDYVEVGESFFVTVKVINNAENMTHGNITVSFPDPEYCDFRVIDHDQETEAKEYYTGDKISYLNPVSDIQARYPLAEVWLPGTWYEGDSHYIKVKVFPRSKGTMRLYVRSVVGFVLTRAIFCPDSSNSDIKDQQGVYVKVYEVRVGAPPTPVPTDTPVPTSTPKPVEINQSPPLTPSSQLSGLSVNILIYVLIGLLGFIILILIFKMKLTPVPANMPSYSPSVPHQAVTYSGRNISQMSKPPPTLAIVSPVPQLQNCSKCGMALTPGKKFCPSCGFAVYSGSSPVISGKLCPSCNKVLLEPGEATCQYCQKKYKPQVQEERIIACDGCDYKQSESKWKQSKGRCPECGFENEI